MVLFIPLLTHKNSANKPMAAYSRSLRSREKELTLVRKKVCAHEKKGLRSRAQTKWTASAAMEVGLHTGENKA